MFQAIITFSHSPKNSHKYRMSFSFSQTYSCSSPGPLSQELEVSQDSVDAVSSTNLHLCPSVSSFSPAGYLPFPSRRPPITIVEESLVYLTNVYSKEAVNDKEEMKLVKQVLKVLTKQVMTKSKLPGVMMKRKAVLENSLVDCAALAVCGRIENNLAGLLNKLDTAASASSSPVPDDHQEVSELSGHRPNRLTTIKPLPSITEDNFE